VLEVVWVKSKVLKKLLFKSAIIDDINVKEAAHISFEQASFYIKN